jgi:hypothetical protein
MCTCPNRSRPHRVDGHGEPGVPCRGLPGFSICRCRITSNNHHWELWHSTRFVEETPGQRGCPAIHKLDCAVRKARFFSGPAAKLFAGELDGDFQYIGRFVQRVIGEVLQKRRDGTAPSFTDG